MKEHHPLNDAWWWWHHAVGCFLAAGTGRLVRVEGMLNRVKVQIS